MTIPSKVAFENFLEIFEWSLPLDVVKEIGLLRTPNRELISKYLSILDALRKAHYKSLCVHEVDMWFEKQENFKRSNKSLFRKVKPIPRKFNNQAEYDDYRINEICESFSNERWSEPNVYEGTNERRAEMNARENKKIPERNAEKSIGIFSSWFKTHRTDILFIRIIKCFYNYFYTDRAIRIYKAKSKANETLRKLEISLNDLLELSDLEEFTVSSIDQSYYSGIFGNVPIRFLEKIKEYRFYFPFERNDQTLKERVLIYDLNKLFTLHFKSPKPNAIFYLLMLEGVKNNIEKRSIERMLAKWKTDTQGIHRTV